MNPLLDHLEKVPAFVTIARCGSLQKAAATLRRSQPSLSKAVRVLEEALGTSLLRRSRNGVVPTAAGQRLLAFGEELLALSSAAKKDLMPGAEPAGTLLVTCHELIAGFIWPSVLSATAQALPRLQVQLHTQSSAREMAKLVERGECDLAIGAELPEGALTKRVALYQDRYGLFAKPGVKPAPRAWRDELIFSGTAVAGPGTALTDALRSQGYDGPSRYEVHTCEAVISMAIAGLGIAVLPRAASACHVATHLLREVRVDGLRALGTHTIYVLAPKREDQNGLAHLFVDHVLPGVATRLRTLLTASG